MPKIKRITHNIIKSEKRLFASYIASRCINKYNLLKASWLYEFKKKFKLCLPFDPEILLLEINHKEIIRDSWGDLTTKIKWNGNVQP